MLKVAILYISILIVCSIVLGSIIYFFGDISGFDGVRDVRVIEWRYK